MIQINPATGHKPCQSCGRLVNGEDPHRRCQKCRNGGKWRTGWTAEYQRAYRKRRAQG